MPAQPVEPLKAIIDPVALQLEADVVLINAPIQPPLPDEVLEMCRGISKPRPNVLLILVTEGGDADAAFRVARVFQNRYKKFILFVTGYCKSAGTLIAVGADELVFAETGELGPLDVQMSKPDEIMQMQSGLTATAALETLHSQALQAFEHFMLQLLGRSGGSISTRTATQIAVQLTCGLFSPLYGHMDPMHVGEAGRALAIAMKYGHSLNRDNLKPNALEALTKNYPSHGYVIDRKEASKLFQFVREPNLQEQRIVDALKSVLIDPISDFERRAVAYLSTEESPTPSATGATDASPKGPKTVENPTVAAVAAETPAATNVGSAEPNSSTEQDSTAESDNADGDNRAAHPRGPHPVERVG